MQNDAGKQPKIWYCVKMVGVVVPVVVELIDRGGVKCE